jgi:hypothetical protein
MSTVFLVGYSFETNFCYYLEFDDVIYYYESQPLGYYFRFNNDTHIFTSDLEVLSGKNSIYYVF